MLPTRRLTLAAIGSAMGVLFLSTGFALQVAVSFWVFMASLCVMLSLESGYIRYGIMSHIVITFLSLVFNGFNIVFLLPYVTFMGVCPIGNAFFEKMQLPRFLSYIIKQCWFTLSIFTTIYLGAGLFFGFSLDSLSSILFIALLTLPTFFFYNLGMVNIRRKLRRLLQVNG